MEENIIEVSNLVKTYGSIVAVDSVSFQVPPGEIFGLVGPNGAGKTTILRAISTLLEADSGRAKVCGYSVKDEPNQVRKLISYLPEEAGAYENLTGRAYLEFMASFFGDRAKINRIVERGLEIADLEDWIDKKINTYSKGMTRRLLIGRALMMVPKLAVLDEPTVGLDVTNAREVRDIIKNHSHKGTTVLLSSHNMFEVEYLCQRVAMINKGRIIEEGRPSALKDKYQAPNLEQVFTEVVQ